MKRLFLFFCIIVLTPLSMSGIAMAKEKAILKNQHLKLYKGEVKVIKIGEIDRVAVGDGKLLSTSITKKGQLIILAEKAGETLVHIWGKGGWERELKIQISESNPQSSEVEIKSLLRNSTGLNVRTVGGRIVIEGLVGPADTTKIEAIKKYYPDIVNLTSKSEASFYDKMVHMKVQITEFSSNALEEVGINWNSSFSGPIFGLVKPSSSNYIDPTNGAFVPPEKDTPAVNPLAGTAGFAYFGILTAISSRINLMQANGDALILASPTLISRSGGEASFLAGGQLPLPTVSATGQQDVKFKDYGIKLKIKPVADNQGNVNARVETELSQPDLSNAVNGIPGILTRTAMADLSMKSGETMVISGLMDSNLSKDVSEVKYLAAIPILGALFRNSRLRDRKTELVIFVTPKVIAANSAVNTEALAQHQGMIDRFKKAVELDDWLDEDSTNADLLSDSEGAHSYSAETAANVKSDEIASDEAVIPSEGVPAETLNNDVSQ